MDVTVKDAGRGTRWVCPNDRHLALRAKLRTGWSVKTGSLDSKWGHYSNSHSSGTNHCAQSFVLTEDEQQAIIQVIQRAEALDLSEQERIGRLVERLENMKRNVCNVTSTRLNERKNCGSRCSNNTHCICSCALCGEKFGAVLGATPNLCKDCRKYICQKCGIETNELSSALQNVSAARGISAAEKPMQERTIMERIVKRSNGGQKQFLCRICAETREMWKKSGAWFFKGMPKYILPEKKERGWSRIGHKTSTWTIGGNKSLESTELQDSSSDEEATRRLALARGHSNSSTNLQKNQDPTVNKTSPFSSSTQSTSSVSKTSPGHKSNGLSPLNNREECLDQLNKSTLSIPSQYSPVSPTPSIKTLRSRGNGKSGNDPQMEQHVSFEDEIADEKDKKLNDMNDVNDDGHKIEFNSYDRLKSSQTEFFNGSNNTDNNCFNTTKSRTVSDTRETYGTGRKSMVLRTGEPLQQFSQQQSIRYTTDTNVGAPKRRSDTKLWNSRSLLAIRPSSSVPPMQSGTSTRLATNGYSWSRRSVLQAQHTTSRSSCDYETTSNKDCSQNTGSGVQRDSKLLWNNRNRCMERQSTAHPDPSGRSVRTRFSRRGEISSARVTTTSNETL